MIKKISFIIPSILLAGCSFNQGPTPAQQYINRMQSAEQQEEWDVKACRALHPKIVGKYYELARCLDEAAYTYSQTDTGFAREAQAIAQARDAAYLAIDRKQVSPERAEEALLEDLKNIGTIYRAESDAQFNQMRQSIQPHNISCTYTDNGYGTTYQRCY